MFMSQVITYTMIIGIGQSFLFEDISTALNSEFSKIEKLIEKAVVDDLKGPFKIPPKHSPPAHFNRETKITEKVDKDIAKSNKNISNIIDKFNELKDYLKLSLHLYKKSSPKKNNTEERKAIMKREGVKNDTSYEIFNLVRHFDSLGLNDIVDEKLLRNFEVYNIDDDVVSNYAEDHAVGPVSKSPTLTSETINRRIFHGILTDIERYPFMASISVDKEFKCAGSIIASEYLLTAASCLNNVYGKLALRTPVDISVRVGSNYHSRDGQIMKLSKIIVHPSYDEKTAENNVVILKFKDRLTLKINIGSVEYDTSSNFDFYKVTVLGWGVASENFEDETTEKKLSKAALHKINIDICQAIFTNTQITKSNFCAGSTSHGAGVCNYDIGGPALLNGKLIGVVSIAYPFCSQPGAPTIFTKIGVLSKWIDNVIHDTPLTPVTSATVSYSKHFLRRDPLYSMASYEAGERVAEQFNVAEEYAYMDQTQQKPKLATTRKQIKGNYNGNQYIRPRHEDILEEVASAQEMGMTIESFGEDEEMDLTEVTTPATNNNYDEDIKEDYVEEEEKTTKPMIVKKKKHKRKTVNRQYIKKKTMKHHQDQVSKPIAREKKVVLDDYVAEDGIGTDKEQKETKKKTKTVKSKTKTNIAKKSTTVATTTSIKDYTDSAEYIQTLLRKVKVVEKNLFDKYMVGDITEKEIISLIKPHWYNKTFYYLLMDAIQRRLKMVNEIKRLERKYKGLVETTRYTSSKKHSDIGRMRATEPYMDESNHESVEWTTESDKVLNNNNNDEVSDKNLDPDYNTVKSDAEYNDIKSDPEVENNFEISMDLNNEPETDDQEDTSNQ